MKKIILFLAFAALMGAAISSAGARTRVSVSFSYGSPHYSCRSVYSHQVVVRTHPRYRYKRFHRPYYSRAYFRNRPHTRIVVRSCY